MNEWYWMMPLTAAACGWLIALLVRSRLLNRLAVLLPGLAAQAAEQFLSPAAIRANIADPAALRPALPLIESHLDTFLRHKLTKSMPVVGMFIGDKTITQLKALFLEELEALFPRVMDACMQAVPGMDDPSSLISGRLASIPAQARRRLIRNALGGTLTTLPAAGMLAGLLTGLVQLAVMVLFLKMRP